MDKRKKIGLILISLFVITQIIGLIVLNADPFHVERQINDTTEITTNPYLEWIIPPEIETQEQSFSMLGSLIFAFIIAILLLVFLSKLKIEFVLKAWFFVVVTLALFLSLLAFEKIFSIPISLQMGALIAIIIAIPLSFFKVYGRNIILHNATELIIYPGISTVFVPILNVWTLIVLLSIISIYDLWAVWRSGLMQKMAKYQINKLNIFPGFVIPHASKKVKLQIAKMKALAKKGKKVKMKDKKIKINIALLGGGDIVFPLIAAGVMLRAFGLTHALFVTAGATLGLLYLYFVYKKKKAYPAMPFITVGIFIGMVLGWILL